MTQANYKLYNRLHKKTRRYTIVEDQITQFQVCSWIILSYQYWSIFHHTKIKIILYKNKHYYKCKIKKKWLIKEKKHKILILGELTQNKVKCLSINELVDVDNY